MWLCLLLIMFLQFIELDCATHPTPNKSLDLLWPSGPPMPPAPIPENAVQQPSQTRSTSVPNAQAQLPPTPLNPSEVESAAAEINQLNALIEIGMPTKDITSEREQLNAVLWSLGHLIADDRANAHAHLEIIASRVGDQYDKYFLFTLVGMLAPSINTESYKAALNLPESTDRSTT